MSDDWRTLSWREAAERQRDVILPRGISVRRQRDVILLRDNSVRRFEHPNLPAPYLRRALIGYRCEQCSTRRRKYGPDVIECSP